jgi:hypothetical protein
VAELNLDAKRIVSIGAELLAFTKLAPSTCAAFFGDFRRLK